jgi:hypothetical protein
MVGGPPSHSAIKRGWGPWLAVRGSPRRLTHLTPQTLTDRGSTGAAGSSATAVAAPLFVDPAHPVSPPDPRPHCTRPVVPEPALHPLRQAAATPATSTRDMASDPALPSNPDGLRPLVTLCFLS